MPPADQTDPETHHLLSYDTCMYQTLYRDVSPVLTSKGKISNNNDTIFFLQIRIKLRDLAIGIRLRKIV